MPWADGVAGPADQAHRLCRRIATMSEGPHPSCPELRARQRTCRRAQPAKPTSISPASTTTSTPIAASPTSPASPAIAASARSTCKRGSRSAAVRRCGTSCRRSRHQADARRPHGFAQLPPRHRTHRRDERTRRPQSARGRPRRATSPRPRARAGVGGAVELAGAMQRGGSSRPSAVAPSPATRLGCTPPRRTGPAPASTATARRCRSASAGPYGIA